MSNLFDYLDWRGDVPFQVDPFNEVDNLVLSVLAYVELDSIVPGPGWDGDCEERSIPDPGFLPASESGTCAAVSGRSIRRKKCGEAGPFTENRPLF